MEFKLKEVVNAIHGSNQDIGMQTLEINNVEYWIRGLGSIQTIDDIKNMVVTSRAFTTIHIKDIANVQVGPKYRSGILDKEGARGCWRCRCG